MDLHTGPKKRKLTKFLCREMLYDYSQGHLDDSRKLAVEEYLAYDEDLQEDLNHLKSAMNYCKELGQAELDPEFLKEISESKTYLAQVADQLAWRNLPEYAKWGIEAVLISLSVAMFAIFVPWDRVLDWIPRDNAPILIPAPQPEIIAGQAQLAESENSAQNVTNSEATAKVNTPTTNENPPPEMEAAESEPLEIKTSEEDAQKAQAQVTTVENNELSEIKKLKEEEVKNAEAEDTEELETSEDKSGKKKTILVGSKQAFKGELYRATIKIDNVDVVTQEIVDKISNLGGKKAGKVKLGWRRKDGSYFHFSMKEVNLEELKSFLSNYGSLMLFKDPHWRVMPEGEIRMILLVEDSEYKKK